MGQAREKIVIFDLDDTLIPNVKYYIDVKNRLAELFQKIFDNGHSKEKIIDSLSKLDMENAKIHGLSRLRFPLSAVELYFNYCKEYNREITMSELDEIIALASTVFHNIDELSSECIEMLKTVKGKGYKVFLLTSGDKIVQTYKVYHSNLFKYIDKENVFIVPLKTVETYIKLFNKYGLENCCMIGNSKKSDINPALNAGMYAIFIPKDTWEFEEEKIQESDKLFTIESLKSIPDILDKIWDL